MVNSIYFGDNLKILQTIPDGYVDLIFIDPPYNKAKTHVGKIIKTERSEDGLVGFGGNRYSRKTDKISAKYNDNFGNNYIDFMRARLIQAHRVLKNNGSFYLIADYTEIHYIKIECDKIFGRENYRGSVYWTWDYGAKSTTNYPNKVNEILYYVKDNQNYKWHYEDLPRIPYMSKLAPREKLEKGKRLTNCWFCSIVGTNSNERKLYNYPTMKPQKILKNIILASSDRGDLCLDFFAGGGSFGEACGDLEREFILIDSNKSAIDIMSKRLNRFNPVII